MEKDTKEYNMLFLDDEGKKSGYQTSTKFISATKSYSVYGYNAVKGSDSNHNYLVYASSNMRQNTLGYEMLEQ